MAERNTFTFLPPPLTGQDGRRRRMSSPAGDGVESCFPAIVAGAAGDIRIAWMDTRVSDASVNDPRTREIRHQPVWNTFYRGSTNGGATWSAEARLFRTGLWYGARRRLRPS